MGTQNNKATWTLAGIGAVFTLAASLGSGLWAASATTATFQSRVQVLEREGEDREKRLRAVEERTLQTANDVRWIRQYLEKAGK